MARISTYGEDDIVQRDDRLIGTDGATNATKNFTVGDLADFIEGIDSRAGTIVPDGFSVSHQIVNDPASGVLSDRLTFAIQYFDQDGNVQSETTETFVPIGTATLKHGTGAPNGVVSGNSGDFYIDTAAFILYGPKTSTGDTDWPTMGFNLRGVKGDMGDTGADGTPATIAIGTVATGAAGSSATVMNSGSGAAAVFDFEIPQGDKGDRGDAGASGARGASVTTVTTDTAGTTTTPTIISFDDSDGNDIAGTVSISPGPTGPRGNQGDRGDTGTSGTAASIAVGQTQTLASGASATVTNSGDTTNAVFDFGLPSGDDGAAATIAVGTVDTGAAGSSATVMNSGTPSAATFDFSIPRGDNGAAGVQGERGFEGRFTVSIFRDYDTNRSPTVPDRPARQDGAYTLATGAFTPPTDWFANIPDPLMDTLYESRAVIIPTDDLTYDLVWSPVFEAGSQGPAGMDGTDGTTWYTSLSQIPAG